MFYLLHMVDNRQQDYNTIRLAIFLQMVRSTLVPSHLTLAKELRIVIADRALESSGQNKSQESL